ncbi:MAG TPA: prolyl oligopeptidase family serine peptidase [Steroidobacteraceae bacterium]|nr:prolyl oligopeptidase family serine peptidase [Steroidobacteraceae bacterium]
MSLTRGVLVVLGVCLAAALLLLGCTRLLRGQGRISYPAAARGEVVDDYHGTPVADPYRWLEELDSPQTRAWTSAQAQLTQSYLAQLPVRARIAARIGQLYDFDRSGIPFKANGRYFYTRNSGRQEQSVLVTVLRRGDPPVTALDPNALPPEGHPVVTGYVPSRDGRLLAYGVSPAGSDWTEWRIRDLAAGADLPDVLRFTKYYPPAFTPDGRGLYYSAFPAPQPGAELGTQDLGNAVYYHALGTPAAADRKVFADAAHPDWQYRAHLTRDGRWLVVLAGEGEVGDKGRENVYLLDLSASAATAVPLALGFEAAYLYVGADGGRLYFLTSLQAPNGRVLAVDPQQPARANWRQVLAEGRDAIDLGGNGVTLVGHRLIVRTLHAAHSRVTIYGLDGAQQREIALPGAGSAAGFDGQPEDRETFYSFTDLVTPPTIYHYDLESGTSTVFHTPQVAFDPSSFEQRQVFYPGKDGTRIPLWLAYRKGLKPDANTPLLLYGYGGFGVAIPPSFNPARIAWLEMGGVFALANIRGGGEYGEAWHAQGIRTHKQVVFDDFIAAAEWLIAQRYTSASRLAIYGRSNGGLLVGACLTQRPDLFAAAVVQVGVLDMLRFNRFGQGAGWEGDYGSPADPDELRALYAYSPVHNVRSGTRYPATLVITGDHDTRVMPMHSFKFTAALQAAQAAPAPVLLAVDLSSGHGGAETVTQAIAQSADMYAFLARNLGMRGELKTGYRP